MSEKALDVVFENIVALEADARALLRRKRFGSAIHVAIAAREETSKYLLLFCKEHLPASIFKKRFSHLPKHRLASASYYISGQVSVAYLLELAAKIAGETDIGRGFSGLSSMVQKDLIVRGNSRRTADAIMAILNSAEDEQAEARRRVWAEEVERHRTSSIYVDVAEDLTVISCPSELSEQDAQKYISGVQMGIAALKLIRDPEMSLSEYVELLPNKEKRLLLADIRPLIIKWSNDFGFQGSIKLS